MDFNRMRFNIAEIHLATGLDVKTLQARKAALVKSGEIDSIKGRKDYSYEEVKKLVRRPLKPGEPRGDYVTALRRQLQTDGYTIRKE